MHVNPGITPLGIWSRHTRESGVVTISNGVGYIAAVKSFIMSDSWCILILLMVLRSWRLRAGTALDGVGTVAGSPLPAMDSSSSHA